MTEQAAPAPAPTSRLRVLPLLLLAPFALVALALVVALLLGLSVPALLYFLWSRCCSLIEDFKPNTRRRTKKKGRAKLELPPQLLNLIPRFVTSTPKAGQ